MKLLGSIFLAAITAVASASSENVTRCGASEPHAGLMMSDHAAMQQANVAATYTINTHVHIVESLAKQGRYQNSQIVDQINVLNNAYAPLGIAFNFRTLDRSINNAWAASSPSSPASVQMRQSLHRGGYNELNLSFLSDLQADNGYEMLLGFCTFPVQSPSPGTIAVDGCLQAGDTLPGGATPNYNLGFTAVHEVGHWFYLLHVFQGNSCADPGDFVDDTPVQSTATSGCPGYKDSCPYNPGADSIHNFMDYSFDPCLDQFTIGQGNRARSAFQLLRANA